MVSKIITMVGESKTSWEDATTSVIKEAQTSLRGITRVKVDEFDVKVTDAGEIDTFRVKAEIAFRVEK